MVEDDVVLLFVVEELMIIMASLLNARVRIDIIGAINPLAVAVTAHHTFSTFDTIVVALGEYPTTTANLRSLSGNTQQLLQIAVTLGEYLTTTANCGHSRGIPNNY